MSYSTNLEEQYIDQDYLVRISPRRKIAHTDFTLVSGSIYKASFDFGNVGAVSKNGTVLTLASSSSVVSGEYYFDGTYVYVFGAPISTDFIIVTYELYLSTGEYDWHKTPTDSASQVVHWEPFVLRAPDTKQSLSDLLLGYQPVSSTNIESDNSEHFWERHIYDSSFNQASIKVWHLIGDLSVTNLRLVFSGFCSNISYSTNKISMTVNDDKDIFENEFRINGAYSDFYNTTEFTNCDPQYVGKPKRRAFGVNQGVKLVNLNYDSENNTISDNNKFGVCLLDEVSPSTPASYPIDEGILYSGSPPNIPYLNVGTTTTTRLYFTFPGNFPPFEMNEVFWYRPDILGPAGVYHTVTAVGSNYVDFTPAAAGTPVTFSLRKLLCSYVYIEQDGVRYEAKAGRDFDPANENGTLVINFNGSYQGNLSMPAPIKHTDIVYAKKVFGKKLTESYGATGTPLTAQYVGEYDNPNYVLTNGVGIVYDILKRNVFLGSESDLDGATFISLQNSFVDELGLMIPENAGDEYPTYKDVLTKILLSLRCRLFKNNDNKWTIVRFEQMGAYDKQAVSDEIIGDISFEFNYSDLVSDVFVEYSRQEKSIDLLIKDEKLSKVSKENLSAKYLHGVRKQKTFSTYHTIQSEAQVACDEFAAIYGDRQGKIRIKLDKRFYDSNIGDVIEIKREDIPGFSSIEGTDNTRKAVVVESTKNLNSVTLTLDDQKGLEDA